MHYNTTIELDQPIEPTDEIMDALAGYHAALSTSDHGNLTATITLPADNLAQATRTAIAVVESATAAHALTVEAMPTSEYDKRQGLVPMPDMVSVTEAADLLGASRQAVLDRIRRGTLSARKVGREYVIQRSALTDKVDA